MYGKDKIRITTETGESVEALAPVIVSASRSTDIPAWYTPWLIHRLNKGYAVWYNPFNQRPQYISFRHTKALVFWTKNPAPMIPWLPVLDKMGLHYYFQFTLNDYEKEKLEPRLPSLTTRIETFKTLSSLIGKEKVIWRFDPLFLSPVTSPGELLQRIENIGCSLKGYTEKLVFSFIDVLAYRKVQQKFLRETIFFHPDTLGQAEFTPLQKKEILTGLARLRDQWKTADWKVELATCAEEIDFDFYGISPNRCIDDRLLRRLFPEDKEFLFYLDHGYLPRETSLFPEEPRDVPSLKKDKGQRKNCHCFPSKDIGMYNTCPHHCIYCYANTSRSVVDHHYRHHRKNNESIGK